MWETHAQEGNTRELPEVCCQPIDKGVMPHVLVISPDVLLSVPQHIYASVAT